MFRFLIGLIALCGLLKSSAFADEAFSIDLTVSAGKASKTVHGESAAPLTRPKNRETVEAKAGERVTVKWKFVNTDQKTTIKDVTIHFYAVIAENAAQAAIKKLDQGVIAESALNMDFGPKEANEGELHFAIDRPGLYLLRVETIGAVAGPAGHEEFAALDVNVK